MSSIILPSKANQQLDKQIFNENSQKKLQKHKSGVNLMKDYLLKKAENMYKLNLSDQQAFKWKLKKNGNIRPLSSFRLIKKQQVTSQYNIEYQDLKDYSFPVLAHKTKDLAGFAFTLLKQNQYFKQKLQNKEFLKKLVTQISLNYNIVSYHNFSHAFSLTLMLFQSFQYHTELNNYFTHQDKFFAFVAGLSHDMNHPGTNNGFDVKMKTKRALQVNNEAVLENFHIKQLWRVLDKNPDINFLNMVENPQKVKKRITYLILMTDVAQHFKNLEKLKALRTQAQNNKQSLLKKQQNREFFLGQIFHACDIGNPCIDFPNYIKWAALLSYEFNQQTILQKQNHIQVTQMLRYKDLKTFYKGQIGFINYLVNPLWKEISMTCSNLKIFAQNIDQNAKILQKMIENVKQGDDQLIDQKSK